MKKYFYFVLPLLLLTFHAKSQEDQDSVQKTSTISEVTDSLASQDTLKIKKTTTTITTTSSEEIVREEIKDTVIPDAPKIIIKNNEEAYSKEDQDSVKTTIISVGSAINTPFDDYAPIISADGEMMIFTSRRPTYKEDIALNVQGMENVYVSYYNIYTWKWSEAKMLGPNINQTGKNNSAIALSNDGQRMLLYRGDPDGNIYQSDLEGEEWSVPVKMPEPINSGKHESSASFSPDGRTIYVVSNRKGGQGGMDLWLCQQDNLGWGKKAVNLGPIVNTTLNEEGVFIHPDGKTLFFSSKGHNSKGGYDIFKSVLEDEKWSTPVSLGDFLNTTDDDLFFNLTANGKTGYYSSVRAGGQGMKDIYEISFKKKKIETRYALNSYTTVTENKTVTTENQTMITEHNTVEPENNTVDSVNENDKPKLALLANTHKKPNPTDTDVIITDNDKSQPNLTLFKGVVIDFDGFNPLGADIEITDNDKNKVIANIKSNSVSGKFLASLPAGKNYGLAIYKEGYVFYSENFNIPLADAYKEIHKSIPLQKLSVGSKIVLKNIFYDYGKATLSAESLSELNRLVKLLSLSIDIKIEVASYTDSKSSDEFNLELSQRRAQAVVDYLFASGISKEQMVAKGYGKANPVASNETEAGRKLNRRTEIRVLEQ